ncbi:efflux RND transporter periplasmic adaptor subunit [Thalassorhabdomicrobium marinisediminis]|uniref:efflux RND transporter periplasmic adaptor subunit n=1 Tax=Thalassorhabdomicrobium marinisediminis TaxID=2170577 RepID=UPI002491CE7B|nr:efflux RND transporter periplasmic adaptor subunit [Thalassorhabdomicrobium marinisediminis]
MRKFLMLIVACAILVGAYALTYGVPVPVLALAGGQTSDAATSRTLPSGTAAEVPSDRGPPSGGRRGAGRGSAGTTVVTEPLQMRAYENVLSAIGTASARRSVEVVSDAAGEVIEANLVTRRDVTAGDVLVRLDARTQTLNLAIAQAELDQANDTLSRYERLQASGNSTVTDVALSEAQLNQRLAEAAVGLAQVALDNRTIRAPIDGRLSLSDVEIGSKLSANSVIASIDQSDALIVEFELPERAIGLLPGADEVLATTSAFTGRVFKGEILSYDSLIDSVTRSVTVKAQIDNSDGLLWPGMTFAVRLTHTSDPLPSVPATALTWSRAGAAIWVDADGVAEQVPVTILFRQGDTVWIEGEIAPGAMVVTEGAHKLRAGAQISTSRGAGERQARPTDGDETSAARPGRRQTDTGAQDRPDQQARSSSEVPT